MCGLSGFIGVPKAQAWGLVYGLGAGIDMRGGHAAGYVSVRNSELRINKKIGEWSDASRKFIRGAAKGDMCMMHARFATCGIRDSVDHAHPFEIRRNDETILYGAHNGVIYDGAEESAKLNGRTYTVDSREVFELLADGEFEAIRNLQGYGVLTWIEPGADHVKMVRLSQNSDIEVCKLRAGGIVWASTSRILHEALDIAGLRATTNYVLPKIGMVYELRANGVQETHADDLRVSSINSRRTGWGRVNEDSSPESWESKLIAKWEAEEAEKELKTKSNYDPSLYSSWERDADKESVEAERQYQEAKDRWFDEHPNYRKELEDEDCGDYPSIAGSYA